MARAAETLALVLFVTACESTPEVPDADATSSPRVTAGRYTLANVGRFALAEHAMEHRPSGELELRRDGSFALEFQWPSPVGIEFGSMIGRSGAVTGNWTGDLGDERLVQLFVRRATSSDVAADLVLLTYLEGSTFHLPQRVVSAVPCGTRSRRLTR